MKGKILIPLLSILLAVPMAAQESPGAPAPVAALERAQATIAETDQTYAAREAEVLNTGTEAELTLPDLPEEPQFEVPQDEVFIDLPGADRESSTVIGADAETISVDTQQVAR